MTDGVGRYERSEAFLRNLDGDWARLIDLVGPCLHDPKAAREPNEALVRAIAYQQLTAKAGDAIKAKEKNAVAVTVEPLDELGDINPETENRLRNTGVRGGT